MTKFTPNSQDDVYLHTGRTFRIRETREEDLEQWYKWFNDPVITKEMIHGVVPNTLEQQREFRNAHMSGRNNKVIFSIVAPDSPELIGTCSINVLGGWFNGHAEISLVIGEHKYHKGLTYMEITAWQLNHAFNVMNMHSVMSATSANNQAVIATLERLNFTKVGVMRECAYRDGQYQDAVYHEILKNEWLQFSKGEENANSVLSSI